MSSFGGAPSGSSGSGAGGAGGFGGTQQAGASATGGAGQPSGGANFGGASGATPGGASGLGGQTAGTAGTSAGSGGTSSAPPGVRVVGRNAVGAGGATRFSWSGVSFEARFSGSQVALALNDSNKNRFTVVIDGGPAKTVTWAPGQSSTVLGSGLASGTHQLLVWRNTEAGSGISEFVGLSGFGTGGALLSPPAAPNRRIEVIGDSISAGAGVEGTSTNCTPGIDAYTNNYLAYGSVAARSLGADVVTIAWSGIGVYRSYGNAPTMPTRYDLAVPSDNTAWDFSKYQPHVVVINLGTNDFNGGDPGQPYVDAYVAFVKHVRSKYADTRFVLIDMYGGNRLTAINQVVSALKAAGETRVESLSFSSVPNNNTACNQHPNTAAHQAMGALLTTRLRAILGW